MALTIRRWYNGDGTWTLADNTLPVLADGPHTITVTATEDAAGNAGTQIIQQ
ncbi:hypothetical protein H2789_03920 [Acinetobacter calcoaceticus]